jgi:hypothetical protein
LKLRNNELEYSASGSFSNGFGLRVLFKHFHSSHDAFLRQQS